MPWGLTGDVIVDGVAGGGGTAGYEGVGAAGTVGVGGSGAVADAGGLLSLGRANTTALREAPAAAEAAATMASVVFDMAVRERKNKGSLERQRRTK